MVVNGQKLWDIAPIVGMSRTKQRANGVSHGFSEAGYDIRLAQEVHFLGKHGGRTVTVYTHDGKRMFTDSHKIGRFTLASAIEEFDMPNTLVGIVHDKSTWARQTLSVFNTVIEPGWKGFLTLELVYHGEEDLIIPAGTGIAQVIFHELSCEAAYEGKYQNQESGPVPARKS